MALTSGGQAVYDELSGRKGIIDGLDDDITEELCEATATAVLNAVFPGDPELVAELTGKPGPA